MTQAQSHWRTAESPAARRRPGPGRRSRLEKTPSPRQAGLDFEKWPNRLLFLSESIVTVSVFLVPLPGSWPGPGRPSGPVRDWQFQVYRLVLVARLPWQGYWHTGTVTIRGTALSGTAWRPVRATSGGHHVPGRRRGRLNRERVDLSCCGSFPKLGRQESRNFVISSPVGQRL